MSEQAGVKTGALSDFLAMAKPNPTENPGIGRKNIAPTHARIFRSVPFVPDMALASSPAWKP